MIAAGPFVKGGRVVPSGSHCTVRVTTGTARRTCSPITGRCRRSSLRSPVTSKLFHRYAMLHESHERTNGRPTAQWSRLEAGRSGDLGPSLERSPP